MVYGEFGEDRIKTPPIGLKKSQKWYFGQKKSRNTGLKFGIHAQLDTGSYMGWVPHGHTSILVCKAKIPKIVFR